MASDPIAKDVFLSTLPNIVQNLTAKVQQVERLPGQVYRVILQTEIAPCYQAGQYLTVQIGSQSQPFSIANAPGTTTLELHIRCLTGHDAAMDMIEELKNSPMCEINLPYGEVTLEAAAHQPVLIFIGASTGFSQLKALIEEAQAHFSYDSLHLYWANATPEAVYLPDLPLKWQQEIPNFYYHPIISEYADQWEGRIGLVHEAITEDFDTIDNAAIFACGSPMMVYNTMDKLQEYYKRPIHYFSDVLSYAPRDTLS